MAKYYWKGTAAGFTTGVTGASYAAWIAATNSGLTKNWAYSIGTIGSGVTGATVMPGVNDSVYFSDRFPTLGSTLSGSTGAGLFTYVLSPCLNSNNDGITASACYIGPFSNQSISGLPLIDTFGYGRVGGPAAGNSSIPETVGITQANNLVGNPIKLRVPNNIYIYDNDLGAYDLNLNIVGTTASTLTVDRVVPPSGTTAAVAFTIAARPWKANTTIRLSGSTASGIVSGVQVSEGVVLGTLGMDSSFTITPTATGATAVAGLRLNGQIFNTNIDHSTASSSIQHIVVDPNIRCFDVGREGNYIFGRSVVRSGDTDTLSPQVSHLYADTLLKSAKRGSGITTGTIGQYTVILGAFPSEAEPSVVTTHKFATEGTPEGSAIVKIRGTVNPMKDFDLPVGRLMLDPTSVLFQQDFVCYNGRSNISTPPYDGIDFGGLIRLNPYNDDRVEASAAVADRLGSTRFGIRFGYEAARLVKFPLGVICETHIDSPYPLP